MIVIERRDGGVLIRDADAKKSITLDPLETTFVRDRLHDLLGPASQQEELPRPPKPIPMFLTCPMCSTRHIDEGVFATKSHHTHSCQSCGLTWRPCVEPTVGVQYLPGFKNER